MPDKTETVPDTTEKMPDSEQEQQIYKYVLEKGSSDVYDQLGIKRTKMSQTVGWIYKPEGNENGDNFVDFGILETNRETEDGGYEKAILMEFNVDGPILDLI